MTTVYVAGVGMTRFTTPRHSEPYQEMAAVAVRAALVDAARSCFAELGYQEEAFPNANEAARSSLAAK